jgi:short-subunit dehydrogenase
VKYIQPKSPIRPGTARNCIVVTGASKGIGTAIARALAEKGHYVACLSRSGKLPVCDDVTPEVAARWVTCNSDVTQPQTLIAVFKALEDDGWKIVGLVKNAGMHLGRGYHFSSGIGGRTCRQDGSVRRCYGANLKRLQQGA